MTSREQEEERKMDEQNAALNTDREIWRGKSRAEFGDPDRFYADSIHVTADGEGIGLNCGGYVIVKPIREWFALAAATAERTPPPHNAIEALKAWEHWYSVDSTEFNRDSAREMGLKVLNGK